MNKQNFHKNFRLNGIAFTSDKELLQYSYDNCKEITPFLTEWFSDLDYMVVQTSGSTGTPKKIHILKQYMINSAIATGDFFELKQKTNALLCLSPDYIAGKMMLVRALVLGWYLDVIKPNSLPLRKEKKYDFVAMVPMQVQKSLIDLHKVRKILVGGGVLNRKILNQIKDIPTKIFQSYGMTETVTHIAIREIFPNYQEYYSTLNDVTIEMDNRGCLIIDAPKVASTKIITNDLIKIISKTQFQWLGRVDNIINSGGVKLVPEQIEEKLQALIPNPFFITKQQDAVLGEKVVLFIESDKNQPLINTLKSSNILSKYEKPKEIIFTDTFIYTETNKINRYLTIQSFNNEK